MAFLSVAGQLPLPFAGRGAGAVTASARFMAIWGELAGNAPARAHRIPALL